MTAARACGGRVEIMGQRSETVRVWAEPNGSFTAEQSLGIARFRRDGGWVDVDLTLAKQPDGSVAPKAHPGQLRLSGSAGTGEHVLASLETGGGRIALDFYGWLPEPALSGPVATYRNIRPGVDLVIEVTRYGYEQSLIVKDASAVRFVPDLMRGLRVTGPGIAPDGDGGLVFKDRTGQRVGHSPVPLMWDSATDPGHPGEPVNVRKLGVALTPATATGPRGAVLTADLAWLTDPARRFPITIDPYEGQVASFDTYVATGTTTDLSTSTKLALGTQNSGNTKRIAYVNVTAQMMSDAKINWASLYLWGTVASSCGSGEWLVFGTVSNANSNTRWSNRPYLIDRYGNNVGQDGSGGSGNPTPDAAFGGSVAPSAGGCTGQWIEANATDLFQYAANQNWWEFTMALVPYWDDTNSYYKEFKSLDSGTLPNVMVNWNNPPAVTGRATVPATPCVTGAGRPFVNTKTPQLRAQITDDAAAPVSAIFEWWPTGGSGPIGSASAGPGASGSWLSTVVPTGHLTEGNNYSWQVRGTDGQATSDFAPWCEFTVDTTAPAAAPTVSCPTYPAGQWAGAAGTACTFTFGAAGIGDVTAYEYGLDTNPPTQSVNAPSLGAGATASVTPTSDGPHTLYVRSRDRAGNQSPITAYQFNVGFGGITAPKSGDITAAKTAVTGSAHPTATGATYQWRRGDADTWVTIPAADVTLAVGGGAVTWPLATSGGGAFPKVNWDVAKTLNDAEAGADALDGPLQLRAVFVGGTGGTSSATKITFDRNQASAVTAGLGPGSINLVTGNYTLSETDVSVDAYGSDLTVSRSFNTRRPAKTDSANMFGPGWTSAVEVQAGNAYYTQLTVTGSLVQIGVPSGDTLGFTRKSADGAGAVFDSGSGFEQLALTYTTATDSYTLRDLDGNVVTFTRVPSTAAGQYYPTAANSPGNNQTTTFGWQKVTIGGAEIVRPTQILAPVPDGVNCTTLTRGCRALSFSYATTTTATGPAESQWGDYLGRVREISFTAWDPDAAPAAMRTVVLARYTYDNTGRLRAAWDPRLDWTDTGVTPPVVRHLWDTYAYDADGVITTVAPTAEEPWQLSYTTVPGDAGKGRLAALTRSALAAGTATNTVVYKVPVSGAGAPYDLSPTQTVRWGQTEAPTDATAVFPATQIPSGNQAAGVLPSSYERAAITYLDANGRGVDQAQPGGHIGATWYDKYANVVRSLTAGNRKRALDAAPSDAAVDEAAIAARLSTTKVFSADGRRMLESFEPEHEVALGDGTIVRGRNHVTNTYDQGAPTTGAPFDLVTTRVADVRYLAGGVEVAADARTSTTEYDWTLRLATKSTVDPGGLALSVRTSYDPVTALVTTVTTPAGGTSLTTPATRRTIYYRATAGSGHSECDLRPEWANLPCRIQPGGQPGSGPELPVTVLTYDLYHQQRTSAEKTSAGVLRTATTTYDGAGRLYEIGVTAATGLGEPVPTRRTVYEPSTGRAVRTQSIAGGGGVSAEVIRGYDTLGRVVSYTDADANPTTTTYDIVGRIATVADGKANRTYTYDGGSERRGLLTSVADSGAGTFSGSYNADGAVTSESWPNGIVVARGYDETSDPVTLTYTKPGCGQADCTLYTETNVDSAHGQLRTRTSTLSRQTFGYDAVGRLTTVADTVAGQCTTRGYGFSTGTNRTSLNTYLPNPGTGICQTTTVASSRTWSYDTADRVGTAGTVYDALGRTTVVPAADTANPTGGNVTVAYHRTDLVKSITQGSRTTDYTIDVTGDRVRSWTDNASGTAVLRRHHFSGDVDSPAWTQENATAWSRMVVGLTGLAGTFRSQTGSTDWQLANLHGDLVATVQTGATGLSVIHEATEYGQPRDPADTGTRRYGWLGAKQRAADTPAGIVLMGVRLYNTATGRFLTVDPLYGGNANAYDYCTADPINCFDLDGRWGIFKKVMNAATKMTDSPIWKGVKFAVGVGAMFGVPGCAVIAIAMTVVDLAVNIYNKRWGNVAWDVVGLATLGVGTRAKSVADAAKANSIASRTKAANLRTQSGSTWRRHIHRAQAAERRYTPALRVAAIAGWAEYAHFSISTANDTMAGPAWGGGHVR